jgi:hypothetical protein
MKIGAMAIASSLAALVSTLALAAEPAVAPVPPAQALPLTGTLFNSDAERAKLDTAQRRSKSATPQTATQEERNQIHGWIRRGDGDTTVWVDGVLVGPIGTELSNKVGSTSVGSPIGLRIKNDSSISARESAPGSSKSAQRKTQKQVTKRNSK